MRTLFLAFLFAAILASATLVGLHQQVSAQQEAATLVVRKIVEGLSPMSDWTFDMELNVPPYSDVITIDNAGGEKTIMFTYTQVAVTVIERTKENYIVYVSQRGSITQTHIAFVGTGELIDEHDTVTVAFINHNTLQVSSPKPYPVGGVILPVNKLAILAPYFALVGLVATISTIYFTKRRGH